MDAPKVLALQDICDSGASVDILEIGFGDGSFLRELIKAGYAPLGVEVSEICVERAKEDIPNVFLVNAETVQGWVGEVICCFEVIEHLEDPGGFIKQLPGQRLYLSTPNPNRWLPRLSKHLLGRSIYETWDFPPNHLHRFQQADLIGLLRAGGYTEIKVKETPVQLHTILTSIVGRGNSENYDDLRPKHPGITGTIRRALIPATFLIASALNILGYRGVSYYVKASRGVKNEDSSM